MPAVATTSFKTAAEFVLPFGQYKGKTIDQVGTTDEGLLYLDWLRGELDRDAAKDRLAPAKLDIHLHLSTYLDDPVIASDTARLAKERAR